MLKNLEPGKVVGFGGAQFYRALGKCSGQAATFDCQFCGFFHQPTTPQKGSKLQALGQKTTLCKHHHNPPKSTKTRAFQASHGLAERREELAGLRKRQALGGSSGPYGWCWDGEGFKGLLGLLASGSVVLMHEGYGLWGFRFGLLGFCVWGFAIWLCVEAAGFLGLWSGVLGVRGYKMHADPHRKMSKP